MLNPKELGRHLPDVPRHVETRAMLMCDECEVFGDADPGFIAMSRRTSVAAAIGRPCAAAINDALRSVRSHIELLVDCEQTEHLRPFLTSWEEHPVTIHSLTSPISSTADDAVGDATLLSPVTEEVRSRFADPMLHREVEHAIIVAAKEVNGVCTSVCYTNYIGETFWDVGVVTLPDCRRRGYARECYLKVAHHLARQGKQPVWGSLDTNIASLQMAASLGFRPVDRLHVFVPPRHAYRSGSYAK